MKIILFNQNPMITKLLESVSKKLELSMEDFNRYQELSTRLKEEPEWILIADDECLEKLDQVDWLELKEIISQNKNSVCMYKKGNEAQPFLEGFEMKIKKPFLPTEVLKVLQKKLGSNMSELEPSQNLDPTQEVLETNWDELENLGDLEALVQEEPNNEEQLLPTLNNQKEKEEVKEEEKEEVKEEIKETPQEEEKPKDDEIQEGETLKDEEVSKELETQEELEIPKEETQEQAKEQEPIKEETQENKEEKQEKTQDSPSAQELEAMQELVKEIQENSNGQENKKETQESTEIPQENAETPQESAETPQESAETPQDVETPQEKETQELETQESTEIPQEKTQEKETQKLGTPQEEIQENTEKTQKLEAQKDHYESIEDIPEPVMAQAMGEKLPFLNESVAKTSNNENDTETPKESVIKTPQEKEGSDKTSSPLELRLNLQDLLKSLNQESLKSLLENKTLSIKITLEDKKPDA
ncbi:chemotaxis regulatory protein ChePep [Helicobacter pylori]